MPANKIISKGSGFFCRPVAMPFCSAIVLALLNIPANAQASIPDGKCTSFGNFSVPSSLVVGCDVDVPEGLQPGEELLMSELFSGGVTTNVGVSNTSRVIANVPGGTVRGSLLTYKICVGPLQNGISRACTNFFTVSFNPQTTGGSPGDPGDPGGPPCPISNPECHPK
jgi:hypothetical protein